MWYLFYWLLALSISKFHQSSVCISSTNFIILILSFSIFIVNLYISLPQASMLPHDQFSYFKLYMKMHSRLIIFYIKSIFLIDHKLISLLLLFNHLSSQIINFILQLSLSLVWKFNSFHQIFNLFFFNSDIVF